MDWRRHIRFLRLYRRWLQEAPGTLRRDCSRFKPQCISAYLFRGDLRPGSREAPQLNSTDHGSYLYPPYAFILISGGLIDMTRLRMDYLRASALSQIAALCHYANILFRSIYKETGYSEEIALARIVVKHFRKTGHRLRLAIDISIWQFQIQFGKEGKIFILCTTASIVFSRYQYNISSSLIVRRNRYASAAARLRQIQPIYRMPLSRNFLGVSDFHPIQVREKRRRKVRRYRWQTLSTLSSAKTWIL